MAVATAATCSDVASEDHSPRALPSFSYQRSDQSGGGSVNTPEEPKETATVTTSGVIRNTTVNPAASHTPACAIRSVAVMCFPPTAGRARSSRQRY